MVSIENKVSTRWKGNSTEDAEKIIEENLKKINKIAENFILEQVRIKGTYSQKIGKSEIEKYGLFGQKKKIVTYYSVELN